ncbi:c-type cytochrome [Paraburkholderia diazotrophica]|uniref:c-type cytochrome n=1 Tax=Paraburkholderia diazotrophica TaxID=667676 RepID=UPI00317E9D5D
MKSKSYAAVLLAGALTLAGTARAESAQGLTLAQKENCMSCHSVTRQFMGPALHDVAARYASRSDASHYLTRKIIEGSAGVWGAVPMPANTQVTPDEAASLASWIMTLK